MDDNGNTTHQPVSQLRQPTRIQPPGRALLEISASADNTRACSMMPPPERVGLKHKGLALPEPAPKRKTLAERAGEASRLKPTGALSSRHVNVTAKAPAVAGMRNRPLAMSGPSQTPRTAPRNATNDPFTPTSEATIRPPSTSAFYRPTSSMGHVQTTTDSSVPAPRPASSLDCNSTASDRPALGKRKGTLSISISDYTSIPSSNVGGMGSAANGDESRHLLRSTYSSTPLRHSQSSTFPRLRDTSLSTAMRGLTLSPNVTPSNEISLFRCSTPSQIPKPGAVRNIVTPVPATPYKVIKRSASPQKVPFLTRDSHIQAWDTKGRLEDIELLYSELTERMNGTLMERNGLEETAHIYKSRMDELEAARAQLAESNMKMHTELDSVNARLATITSTLADEQRRHTLEIDELGRRNRDQLDSANRQAREESNRTSRAHADDLNRLKRQLQSEVESERDRRVREIQELTTQKAVDLQRLQIDSETKEKEIRGLRRDLEQINEELGRERGSKRSLQDNLAVISSNVLTLESTLRASKCRVEDLELEGRKQTARLDDMQQRLQDTAQEAEDTKVRLQTEESLRRKLHNQVQELKGNIRVFCRVRPSVDTEPLEENARITYPDSDKDRKEIEVQGLEEKSSLGNVSTKKNTFVFDRVFSPDSQNTEVFEEISQLVQSALDGYNVCIFCYGQTGSGKTYTMSADDGMIPRALHQIYETAQTLQDKGWRYSMEGSFVEVYNENLNDLLGRPEDFDKKKHEIRHDMHKCKTYVSELTSVLLDTPGKVESILRQAAANRSVAATKANERSSRGHSVFILRLTGENHTTGERSEGTLNLVDLAGSERLSQSGSTGDRLKETQNINRSLSCLGDVIGALGQGKEGGHVPYRNSKLTYLLQFSLGGNSKTLMFVMISPLQAHLSETLTSLKFATKVHNTHIGTAKKQARIRDSSSSSS